MCTFLLRSRPLRTDPRQRLDQVRADLDAGRISEEEYERQASEISIEM